MIITQYAIYDDIQDIHQKYYPNKTHPIYHGTKVVHAQIYQPISELIWVVSECGDDFNIGVYDKNSQELASLIIEDNFGASSPLFVLLPEPNKIALDLMAGQDGSQMYLLKFDGHSIFVEKQLDENVSYFFTVNNHNMAICWNFYDNLLLKFSYPNMEILESFDFNELDCEWCMTDFIKINENLLVTPNGYDGGMYLFDVNTMTISDELLIKGYDLRKDDEGILVSDVNIIGYENNRFIFGVQQNKQTKYLVSNEIYFN